MYQHVCLLDFFFERFAVNVSYARAPTVDRPQYQKENYGTPQINVQMYQSPYGSLEHNQWKMSSYKIRICDCHFARHIKEV